MDQHKTPNKNAHAQRGVYAVEWAIVFPVFFVILYAIVGYGLAFLVRESMQYAVEDGARAALRYQPSRQLRMQTAQSVVRDRLAWLPLAIRPELSTVEVQICRMSEQMECASDLLCGSDVNSRCLILVSLNLSYGESPLAPPLPGLGFLLPQQLAASASVMADKGGV